MFSLNALQLQNNATDKMTIAPRPDLENIVPPLAYWSLRGSPRRQTHTLELPFIRMFIRKGDRIPESRCRFLPTDLLSIRDHFRIILRRPPTLGLHHRHTAPR